ncbi:MAG: hypothetical protein ABIA93_07725 [Candidatus Woesearchaeota archaeon]
MFLKNNYFRLSAWKIVVILFVFGVTFLFPMTLLGSGPCVDGANFGYCINYHGFPFPTFVITGEVQNMPHPHFVSMFFVQGIIGFVLNLLFVYLLVSLIFYPIHKRRPIKLG